MTPLHIAILLHYHCVAEPYAKHDPEHANSRATTEYRSQLIGLDLIERDDTDVSMYHTTPKGKVLVEMLCATPMPIQKWSAP